MIWQQVYNPLNSVALSTFFAAIPVVVLLGTLAIFHMKAHWSAILGLASALVVAIFIFNMPADMALATAGYGALFGLLPIGWIILHVIFLYRLTKEKGWFDVLQESLTGVTQDSRLQLVLIAFCFGAFFEGAAGFGTPVAVTAAILIGLGFPPLQASGLALIANTAPVAFGALGIPITTLAAVTKLDEMQLSMMAGRQLPFFSLLVPFWLVWAYAGFKGIKDVWPAILVAGVTFAIPQFLVSNLHGPSLVDIIASLVSMACLTLFLLNWKPKKVWGLNGHDADMKARGTSQHTRAEILRAWMPWIILSVLVFLWGLPVVKGFLNGLSCPKFNIPFLHNLIERVPPVVLHPEKEKAVYVLNWLSATGTGILISAIISGLLMGYSLKGLAKAYWETIKTVRFSMLTIAAMLALGFTTRYSGLDATLGLTCAMTGWFYPFFGTLLGWLGVALTGSDTASNVLFGGLQRITAEQIGLSPVLMASANSTGGVMGKMIDAQSIVVASTATQQYGKEGEILRYVFWHSIALASLVGVLVFLQAYVWPFSLMVVK
ncbi:MAG: L-lactate permease [Desulfarculus sp.]|nr:L-lactate permease [Desulfarculus sp.]